MLYLISLSLSCETIISILNNWRCQYPPRLANSRRTSTNVKVDDSIAVRWTLSSTASKTRLFHFYCLSLLCIDHNADIYLLCRVGFPYVWISVHHPISYEI
ncbi:hypothetical protein GE21DRAFT_1055570 [Neurospora crassa]|nr:hypothetical protein B13N20.80 [imported] - Neurospora crassa [Neurospora crassa]KHE87141.1 hypothetical protein GE21DRAFT_1055570 [Neurospora crassa]